MEETTATVTAPEPTVEAPVQETAVRVGDRVVPAEPPVEQTAEETPLEQPTEAQPAAPEQPEQSAEYQAGFEAALEQLAEYDRYEAEVRQREAVYEQLGEHVGMTGPQVQQLLEAQAREQLIAQQQQAVTSAETQNRQAQLHRERLDLLDHSLARIAEGVGEFDADEAVANAQLMASENPEWLERHGFEGLLYAAAEHSARQIADGNARVDHYIDRVNRHVGVDPEFVRAVANQAFDPAAPDQGAEIARAIAEGVQAAQPPVRFGTRVTDRYAELKALHDELADRTPPPRPERRVQLRDSGQARDAHGRFITAERVTDRYRRESAEAEAEQRRLTAHQNLMRSKGLL